MRGRFPRPRESSQQAHYFVLGRQGLARAVSCHVATSAKAISLSADVAAAVRATLRCGALAGESRVATLAIPHDLQWAKIPAEDPALPPSSPLPAPPPELLAGSRAFLTECAAALRAARPGKVALILGGRALLAEEADNGGLPGRCCGTTAPARADGAAPDGCSGGALRAAGRVAAALGGAPMFAVNGFARADRGAGLPALQRLPYFPADCRRTMSAFDAVLLLDAPRPVPMFGYEQCGSLIPILGQPDDSIWELDACPDLTSALRTLADCLGAPPADAAAAEETPLPRPAPVLGAASNGRLTPALLCAAVAALQARELSPCRGPNNN